jgi:hypothetical protein
MEIADEWARPVSRRESRQLPRPTALRRRPDQAAARLSPRRARSLTDRCLAPHAASRRRLARAAVIPTAASRSPCRF